MRQELKHHGILGMHWGRKKGSDDPPPNTKSRKISFPSNFLNQKLRDHKPSTILTGKNVAKGILLAYGLLSVHGAISHLQKNPIKIYIDYTKPPFKRAVDPFFKVTIKKIVPKLLPGG